MEEIILSFSLISGILIFSAKTNRSIRGIVLLVVSLSYAYIYLEKKYALGNLGDFKLAIYLLIIPILIRGYYLYLTRENEG
ncbi:MAG: hypothetical protein CME66_13355 [Halobacteriovoraceae bacterium]|nr:hypothetical protein [Halobacteriovoraceae bacterium]